MKYQISDFKISPKDEKDFDNILKKKLKINNFKYRIIAKSIDARKENDIKVIYKLLIETNEKIKLNDKVTIYKDEKIDMKYPNWEKNDTPIIVGFGPAGMFCALFLARCNAKPIIIERGSKIEDRVNDVNEFIKTGKLNTESNVQFGEGGAGTFSDGKLTTNLRNPLIKFILEEFYKHGAKEDVLYDAKPHVGTDYLRKIVKNIREEIISLGGKFYFNTKFEKVVKNENNLIVTARNNNEVYSFETNHLILGLGHSAKDTIRMLYNELGMEMEAKAFSMGVRIEHPKELIDKAQYKEFYKYLPSAYYNLAYHNNENRGVYTFCMCPGGYVLASQSDKESIVVNGMSNNDRGNINSNSAILVDVKPTDYYKSSVLDGLDFQEYYEHKAYILGGSNYSAPVNLVKEFLNDEVAKEFRSVKPSYPLKTKFADLKECLPDFVINGLKDGIVAFDKKLKGFNYDDAILTGIESRSSCPIRMIRDEYLQSNIKYIYPIGEGAGYAGGITSAALDGLKCAIKIAEE